MLMFSSIITTAIIGCHLILMQTWRLRGCNSAKSDCGAKWWQQVISLYLLCDTMNTDHYLQILENYVWSTVSGFDNIDDLIFIQDGVPPHFALAVRAWLDQHFPGHWMAQCWLHEWPPRNSDFTLCDFYLWGYTKIGGVQDKTLHTGGLRDKIQEIFNDITENILQRGVHSIPGCLRKLVDATGAYIKMWWFTFIFPCNKAYVSFVSINL